MNQRRELTKRWRTIKEIDSRAKPTTEIEVITLNGILFSSSKQLAAKFSKQFNTSKMGIHISSNETRLIRETKRKRMKMAQKFTTDLVMRAIESCRNSNAVQ